MLFRSLGAELDRRVPTARVELVHVAASVVVGVLAYHGANALYGLSIGSSVAATPAALAALVAAGVGLAALVAALAD